MIVVKNDFGRYVTVTDVDRVTVAEQGLYINGQAFDNVISFVASGRFLSFSDAVLDAMVKLLVPKPSCACFFPAGKPVYSTVSRLFAGDSESRRVEICGGHVGTCYYRRMAGFYAPHWNLRVDSQEAADLIAWIEHVMALHAQDLQPLESCRKWRLQGAPIRGLSKWSPSEELLKIGSISKILESL